MYLVILFYKNRQNRSSLFYSFLKKRTKKSKKTAVFLIFIVIFLRWQHYCAVLVSGRGRGSLLF